MRTCISQGIATVEFFDARPSDRIRTILKRNGFRWSPVNGYWCRKRVTGAADVFTAIDRILNSQKPDGICWHCKTADGRFRQYGAATPVLCDACNDEYAAAREGGAR